MSPNRPISCRPDRPYDDDAFVTRFAARQARDIIVMDGSGKPIRSTLSQKRSYLYASQFKALSSMARNVVRDLDPSNDVTFMRMRTPMVEVHISLNREFILAVIQKLYRKKR